MIFFRFPQCSFFERRGLQRYELFRIPQIFFKFFKNFFPPRRSSKQPFSEAGCKGTLFSFTSKSFSRFFLIFSEKAVQIAGRDASRAATEPTRNDATAEKLRQKSCGRKVAGGKLLQKRGDRKIGAGLRSGGSHGSHDWCPTIRCVLALLRKNIYLLYNSDSRRLSRPVQPVPGIPEKW